VQRIALGGLFLVLGAGLALVGLAAARDEVWVVAAAAVVLGLWLAGLGVRVLR
jgi:hypothetical protein